MSAAKATGQYPLAQARNGDHLVGFFVPRGLGKLADAVDGDE
jgi:hypothetical protein